jgi:hypothetical protein
VRDLGVRLQLQLGTQSLTLASYDIMDALLDVDVTNNDRERDGFQMTFSLSRTQKTQEQILLKSGLLDPPSRVCIIVIIQGKSQVLINGVITKHQVIPSQQPGQSRLVVTGEDTGCDLDRKERNDTYPNQADSSIVETILGHYHGFNPEITATSPTPSDKDRVPSQHHTDLAYIRQLAGQHSFVFFTEPTSSPGISTAYWGPRERKIPVQPSLTINMGSATNLEQLSFDFNALAPVTPEAHVIDPKKQSTVAVPASESETSQLSNKPAETLRKTLLRDTAKLDTELARQRAQQARSASTDAVTAHGELDVTLYGQVLRSRRKVDVRGVGQSYDGTYYVTQVTHRIKRGEYKQSFTLTREGRGSQSSKVAQ